MFEKPSFYQGSPLLENEFNYMIQNQAALKKEYRKGKAIGKSRAKSINTSMIYDEGLQTGFVNGREYGLRKGALDVWTDSHPDFKANEKKLVFTNEGSAFTFGDIAKETSTKSTLLSKEITRVLELDPNISGNKRKEAFMKNWENGYEKSTFKSKDNKKSFMVFDKSSSNFTASDLQDAVSYNNYFSPSKNNKAIINPYSSDKIYYKDLDKPFSTTFTRKEKSSALSLMTPPTSPMKTLPSSNSSTPNKGKGKSKSRTPKKNKG